jgi:hypothetical protein
MNSRRLMRRSSSEDGSLPYWEAAVVHRGKFGRSTSALDQKQTSNSQQVMSALPPKADIAGRRLDVRFVPFTDLCIAQEYSRNGSLLSFANI